VREAASRAVIDGSKQFITNATTAGLFVVFARTAAATSTSPGIAVFLVPADAACAENLIRPGASSYSISVAFREYFPPEWAGQPGTLTRSSEVHVLDVPSSAPPSTPTLLYAVPTLRWEDLSTPDAQVTLRHGGGVGMWLERGWWSSGAGERLGVVSGPTILDVNDPRYNVTSFIGQDRRGSAGLWPRQPRPPSAGQSSSSTTSGCWRTWGR
jgi:hypothetical protein